jgi:E3 ubiquitin-protein ligase DOA10
VKETLQTGGKVKVQGQQRSSQLCKICWEGNDNNEAGKRSDLIAPCQCKGSMRYVHETCLLRWLKQKGGNSEHETTEFTKKCELCQYLIKISRRPVGPTRIFRNVLEYFWRHRNSIFSVKRMVKVIAYSLYFWIIVYRLKMIFGKILPCILKNLKQRCRNQSVQHSFLRKSIK